MRYKDWFINMFTSILIVLVTIYFDKTTSFINFNLTNVDAAFMNFLIWILINQATTESLNGKKKTK